ncbi:MAG: flavin reductase [Marinomonas gallaica]
MTAAENLDAMRFRNALGKFATGVTVVTAKDLEGGYVGTTASSFNSVSLDPALVLWSIDNNARSLPAYEKGEHFVVNMLAADQVSVSNHFARQQEDKFDGMEYELNAEGIPVLPGCAATFECKLYATYEGGDHTIIVGEVIRFDTSNRKTLLFHQGAYCVSEYHPAAENRVAIPANEKQMSFAENYLPYLLARGFYQVMDKIQDMLNRQGMTELEYRVLASLLGLKNRTRKDLQHYSVLDDESFEHELDRLSNEGFVNVEGDQVSLTETGKEHIGPLLLIAKANEADALGQFNVEEALLFKRYLRMLLEWTA